MPRSEPRLADIDRWIAAAYSDLGVHRARFADCPSGEGASSCEAAEEHLNELLHLRHVTSQGPGSSGGTDVDLGPVRSASGTG